MASSAVVTPTLLSKSLNSSLNVLGLSRSETAEGEEIPALELTRSEVITSCECRFGCFFRLFFTDMFGKLLLIGNCNSSWQWRGLARPLGHIITLPAGLFYPETGNVGGILRNHPPPTFRWPAICCTKRSPKKGPRSYLTFLSSVQASAGGEHGKTG